MVRKARFIATVSETLTRPVASLNPDIFRIRPMVDISAEDAKPKNFLSRELKPWQLLFVGRLEDAKGVRELVRAAELLAQREFAFQLTLVGGGPLYEELFARYGELP